MGQSLARVRDQLGGLGRGAALGGDDRVHGLTPLLVRHTGDRHFSNRGVLDQYAFHLCWVDDLGAGDDHVLNPVLDVEIALLVHPACVSRPQPPSTIDSADASGLFQ